MSKQFATTIESSSARRQAARVEWWLLVFTASAAGLLMLVPAWPLLSGRVPIYFDLGLFHLPVRAFYSRCLADGCSFDWMPHFFTGMFISGEGEHGPYHPLHLFLYRRLPLDTAFALETFLHCPLLLIGLFIFLHRYVRAAAALFGAVCYTFCAESVLHNIYPNYQGVIAHLPWILWLMDAAATTQSAPRRRLALCGVAVLTGSQLLLGSPQALSFSLFAEALFAVFLMWHRRPAWTFWLQWIAANLLGLLIGSVQLLATRTLLANSTRDGFDPLMGSLRPSLLLQLIAPDLLSRHLPQLYSSEPLYFGAVPLLLGVWWLAVRRKLPAVVENGRRCREIAANRLAYFAVALGLLAAWLALGKYGYLYYLQIRLPLVGQFRLPGRYFTLVGFAASILAAVVFDRLLSGIRSGWRISGRLLYGPWVCVAAALLLAVVLRIAYAKENGSSIHRNYFSGTLFLSGAALALTLVARGRAIGLFALVALTVVDIEVFGLNAPIWPRESLWGGLPTLTEFRARAESPPLPRQGRWLDSAFEMPQPPLFDQAVLQGYRGGLEPKKYLDYRNVTALRVAHTAWQHLSRCDKPMSLPGLRHVTDQWFEVPDPLPRVRLVNYVRVSDDPATDIQNIDADTTALVTHPLDVDSGAAGDAELLREQPGELWICTAAPGRRLLIVADSYDLNWRLFVDGETATVERVNGDFLGCVVEGGEHDVHFVFRPVCIRYGQMLSLAGGAMVLLIAGLSCLQVSRISRTTNRSKN